MFAAKRLGKELQKAKDRLPPGIELVKADDFQEWHVDIRVLDGNPLYKDQIYRLRFKFTNGYPINAPEVTFIYVSPSPSSLAPSNNPSSGVSSADNNADSVSSTTVGADEPSLSASPAASTSQTGRPIPIHPHIYSNGIICLDLLGSSDWSPVQSVETVCVSIQSMLTGNTKNERPPGDEEFCRSMSGPGARRVRDVRFVYDDTTV